MEQLANEFVYRRFVMSRDRMNSLFKDIGAGEYETVEKVGPELLMSRGIS